MDTYFYLDGIHFALRGEEEHSMWTIDQFRVEYRDEK